MLVIVALFLQIKFLIRTRLRRNKLLKNFVNMEEPTETDEFEKYFKKSHASKLYAEDLLRRGSLPESGKKANKKNKDRRGSSCKQQNLENNKQSRKSVCSPTGEGSYSLLKPQLKVCDASSLPSSRQGSFKLTKTHSARDIQDELLKVSDEPQRRTSLTPEEMAENKLKEIKQLQNDDFFVVRSFLTSPKGLVNRGDSFKKKPHSESSEGQRKNTETKRRLSEVTRGHRSSVHSTSSATISDVISANALATSDPIKLETGEKYQLISRPSIEITRCFFPNEVPEQADKIPGKPQLKRLLSHESPHAVIVLGDHRVGKTSLVTQFLTSEHLAGLDTSHDSAEDDRTISVSVDGVETLLNFIDVDVKDFRDLESLPCREFAAFLVVYSITDSSSFYMASGLVENLCKVDDRGRSSRTYSVIMVANKGDLVRNRKVLDSDAKEVCNRCGCKFIEVSAGLNHKTDELLVGVVCQVRLNDKRKELLLSDSSALHKSSTLKSSSYFGWVKKLLGLKGKVVESQCYDLHSL